jgi:hypothetical protein
VSNGFENDNIFTSQNRGIGDSVTVLVAVYTTKYS